MTHSQQNIDNTVFCHYIVKEFDLKRNVISWLLQCFADKIIDNLKYIWPLKSVSQMCQSL